MRDLRLRRYREVYAGNLCGKHEQAVKASLRAGAAILPDRVGEHFALFPARSN